MDPRTAVAVASVALALVCVGWTVFQSKRVDVRSGAAPVAAGAARGAGAAVPVVVVAAQRSQIDIGIEAIGTAIANEAVSISSKTSNIVTAIRFTDGQAVQAGQVLVELDRQQLTAELAAANAAFDESRSQFNRSRELLNTQVLSKAQHEQLEATMKTNEAQVASVQARLSDTYIRAPFAGTVGLRRVSLGTLISPGTVITTLDDTSSIKVDFSVPELYIGELRAGQSMVAHTNAYPGRDFVGKLVSVDSRVDPTTRAITARAVVPNADRALRPGMFLNVALSQEQRLALVVPEEALVPEQARQFLYVMEGARAAKREVSLGRRQPGVVEITKGIEAGELVIVEGTLRLRDGAPVRQVGIVAADNEDAS